MSKNKPDLKRSMNKSVQLFGVLPHPIEVVVRKNSLTTPAGRIAPSIILRIVPIITPKKSVRKMKGIERLLLAFIRILPTWMQIYLDHLETLILPQQPFPDEASSPIHSYPYLGCQRYGSYYR